jgi:hypothetical protein
VSKTDKDRPDWVIRHTEGFPLSHDHRHGECVIETLEYARNYNAGSNRPTWRHKRSPKHGHYEEYYCTRKDPFVKTTWSYRWLHAAEPVRYNLKNEATCWAFWRDYDPESPTYHEYRSTQCVGPHRRWIEHENVDCEVCAVERPTCDPSWYGEVIGWRYWTAYGTRNKSLSEWCKMEFHGPERRRERDSLREDLKAYNAGDELADWDFENRQGRRSVQWHLY